jgi:3-hydroxyisobutyrate dehydrogenase-like beta-hydroxyacid dehydrogenase
MKPIVAVIAAGMMGSGVASRLAANGIAVRTSLAGRGAATRTRAEAAGMADVTDQEIVACDFILSIVPPGEALHLAERLTPVLQAAPRKPIYVDCNAVNPTTLLQIARVLEQSGTAFVDGGIIGPPPKPEANNSRIYLAGPAAPQVAVLAQHGLDMPVLPGPVGAASALKMSYAGITKGFTALGAAMLLAATGAGTSEDLKREMAASQPALLAWLTRQVPGMPSKAYRWVAEMEEIAGFVGEDLAAAQMFTGAARLYDRLAADLAGDQREIAALEAFCRRSS